MHSVITSVGAWRRTISPLPPSFQILGLAACKIGPPGLVALATGLKRIEQRSADTPLDVYIGWNTKNEECVAALREAMVECTPWLKVHFH